MKKWLYIFTVIGCIQISCVLISFGENPAILSYMEGDLSFDPKSVFDNIEKKREDAFVSIENVPAIQKDPSSPPVNWDQAQFDQIAQTAFKEVWNDTIQSWELEDISFTTTCADSENGLQFSSYKFFKIETGDKNSRKKIEHRLYIQPRNKQIHWSEEIKVISTQTTNSINLSDFLVSADEALHISEEKGGKRIRSNINNQCSIDVSPLDREGYFGWKVDYYSLGDSSADPIFEILVE